MKSLWACIIVAGLAIPAATSIATIRATNRVLVDRNFGDLGIEIQTLAERDGHR